jgi:hypothetical protein
MKKTPETFIQFLDSLSDQELDQFLSWVDGSSGNRLYELVAEWIDKNRPELARQLFGSGNVGEG